MSTALTPRTLPELVDAVRSAPRVIAVGAGTKPRLSQVDESYARLSTAALSGMVEYEPSEFTFTALAGTPVRDIAAVLAQRGQYLPFEPMLARAGSTLGGAVAGGLSGSGRFRYGGLRDFILGVRFVDGAGRLLRMGGKVVKNAAGFDFPKFLVGSAGRFGVLAEVSFKVFPRPLAWRTVRIEAADIPAKLKLFADLARGRWEIDALDAPVEEPAVYARVGGCEAALDEMAADILGRWRGAALTNGDADFFWHSVNELRWAHSGGGLAKYVLTPECVAEFATRVRTHGAARGWIAAAGNVGYVSVPAGVSLPDIDAAGVRLRGEGPLWLGRPARFEIMRGVKRALDPDGRFPGLDDVKEDAAAVVRG